VFEPDDWYNPKGEAIQVASPFAVYTQHQKHLSYAMNRHQENTALMSKMSQYNFQKNVYQTADRGIISLSPRAVSRYTKKALFG